MKKRIIIPAILSAVLATGLTSCVKDNESDSVKNLRDAKAEELRGSAESKKADAALTTAKVATQAMITKFHEAQAAKEAALAKKEEYEAAEKQLTLAKNQAKSEHEIAQAVAQVEKTRLEAERLLAVEKAKLDGVKEQEIVTMKKLAELEADLLEAQNELFNQKASKYNAILSKYNDAAGDVVGKTKEIIEQKVNIAKAEQDLTNEVEGAKKRFIKMQEDIIAQNEAFIKALDGLKSGSTEEYAAKLEEQKAKVQGAALAAHTATSTGELDTLEKVAEKADKAISELEIFEAIESLQKKVNDGKPLYNTYLNNVQLNSGVVATNTLEELTKEGVIEVYSKYKKYEVVRDLSSTVMADLDHVVLALPAERVAKEEDLKKLNADETEPASVKAAEKTKKDAEDALKTAEKDFKDGTITAAALETARRAVADATRAYLLKVKERKEVQEELTSFNDVIAEFKRVRGFFSGAEDNEDVMALNAAVEKYNTAVQKAADRFFVEQALIEEKGKLKKVEGVLEKILKGYTTYDEAYDQAFVKIEAAKVAIAGYNGVTTKEGALAVAKETLARYEREKAKLEMLAAAYKKQLEAIKFE